VREGGEICCGRRQGGRFAYMRRRARRRRRGSQRRGRSRRR
jgi:hypothetical protein